MWEHQFMLDIKRLRRSFAGLKLLDGFDVALGLG
jgi:hypothetical protein